MFILYIQTFVQKNMLLLDFGISTMRDTTASAAALRTLLRSLNLLDADTAVDAQPPDEFSNGQEHRHRGADGETSDAAADYILELGSKQSKPLYHRNYDCLKQ